MNPIRCASLISFVLLAVGCRHHTLTPRIGGRSAQTLRAEANKIASGWVITLPLPLGEWTPKAVGEDQPMEVISVDGKATARWRVSPERWGHSDRPFYFVLVGRDNVKIEMSVTYTLLSRGSHYWLHVLTRGTWPLPQR